MDQKLLDRDLILAIVAEYYIDDDAHLRQAKIMRQDKMPLGLRVIDHGTISLWYDDSRNVVYI